MFDPQLFGLSAEDYLRAAQTLFAPMIGFLFLYLLQLPLKTIPFISAATDYKPPKWLLPIFALGTSFSFVLFLSTGITLQSRSEQAPVDTFIGSFRRTRNIDVKNEPNNELKAIKFALDYYDGRSDFRIFVNGYRIFGSSSNCMLKFQCRDKGDAQAIAAEQEFQQIDLDANSFLHIFERYELPHFEDISNFLLEGGNSIDIHAANAGAGACDLSMRLIFALADGTSREYRTAIKWQSGPQPLSNGPLLTNEIFFAGGPPASPDVGDEAILIDPYRTPKVRIQYRLCERIHIQLSLTSDAVHSLQKEHPWEQWARDRVTQMKCKLEDGPKASC